MKYDRVYDVLKNTKFYKCVRFINKFQMAQPIFKKKYDTPLNYYYWISQREVFSFSYSAPPPLPTLYA